MNKFETFSRLVLVLGALIALSACSTLTKTDDPTEQISSDPFSSWNRGVYKFNDGVDKVALRPVAKAYHAVVPDPAERSVGRFFSNLGEPLNIVNNLLQGKVDGALSSTYRFAVNSTIGLFGLFDVAKSYDVTESKEDFGQTLASWGVKPGPYLMLPLLGPTNLRDGFGRITDTAVFYPINEISDDSAVRTGLNALSIIDTRAGLLGTDDLLGRQLDPYLFLKEAYDKNRLSVVYDGAPPEQSEEDLDF